jgi:hypothetical protein
MLPMFGCCLLLAGYGAKNDAADGGHDDDQKNEYYGLACAQNLSDD